MYHHTQEWKNFTCNLEVKQTIQNERERERKREREKER
jgi:hypothetical protein